MNKQCHTCNICKPLSEYYSNGQGYLLRKCKKCQIDLNRSRRKANPDKFKNVDLRQCFGITLTQYNEMLAAQNSNCAICQTSKDSFRKALAVDHCHKTGRIRGLLCQRCNLFIGQAEDNPSILSAAIQYLIPDSAASESVHYIVRRKLG